MTSIETQMATIKAIKKKEINKQVRDVLNDTIKHLEDFKKFNNVKGCEHHYCLFLDHKGYVDYYNLKNKK